jgi:outer membrane autotransporter protein
LVDGWAHSHDGISERMASVGLTISYVSQGARPIPRGVFLTGGVGLSNYQADSSVSASLDTVPAVSGTGWGLLVGVGYEFRVGRHVLLTPVGSLEYGIIGNVRIHGTDTIFTRGWKQHVYGVGLGVTFEP